MNPGVTARSSFQRQAKFFACLLFSVVLVGSAYAQPKRFRPQPNYAQLGKPDQAEGRKIVEDLRLRALPSDYFWEIELRLMPRRGDERTVPGRLWGSRNDRGPITRVELDQAQVTRLLIQNGNPPSLWVFRGAPAGTTQKNEALFSRLADTELTPFDLQMPYLYWSDFIFEGVVKHLNRPAQSFLFYPPAEITAVRPELTGIRLLIDSQFHAPVQIQEIGENNRSLKTIRANDVVKVDEQWIVKSIDIRDDLTRDKTRLIIKKAAMNLDFSPALFAPAELASPLRPPSPKRLKSIAP